MRAPRIAIFTIGNELLRGVVRDSLGHELSQLVFEHGGEVAVWEILPDDVERISARVSAALESGVDLLVTTGGLGPTEDDVTAAALSRATSLPLEPHAGALAHVRAFYDRASRAEVVSDNRLTEEREKMARLPRGADLLENSVGAAPGILIHLRGVRVVALPGVPREARGIMDTSMQRVFAEVFGTGRSAAVSISTAARDESALARALEPVRREFPEAAIKTRPRAYGRAVRIEVHISTRGRDLREAKARLQKVARRIVALLRE